MALAGLPRISITLPMPLQNGAYPPFIATNPDVIPSLRSDLLTRAALGIRWLLRRR